MLCIALPEAASGPDEKSREVYSERGVTVNVVARQ